MAQSDPRKHDGLAPILNRIFEKAGVTFADAPSVFTDPFDGRVLIVRDDARRFRVNLLLETVEAA